MKESTRQLFVNAGETLNAAELLVEQGFLRDAASRAYYGAFYIAEALLNEKELSFRKHGAVHSAFAQEFVMVIKRLSTHLSPRSSPRTRRKPFETLRSPRALR